jgi:hypothetical protein
MFQFVFEGQEYQLIALTETDMKNLGSAIVRLPDGRYLEIFPGTRWPIKLKTCPATDAFSARLI